MNTKNTKGFTMLEMIVAIGVFATVAVLSVSSLLSLVNAQKKAMALQDVQDNLRFAMETMARDIRQGNLFYCGFTLADIPVHSEPPDVQDCVLGTLGPSITFRDKDYKYVTYRLGDAAALGAPTSCDTTGSGHKCIEKLVRNSYSEQPGAGSAKFIPVTSLDAEITRLNFYVTGSSSDASDMTDPRITIVVAGYTGKGINRSDFNLQTSVSRLRLSRD